MRARDDARPPHPDGPPEGAMEFLQDLNPGRITETLLGVVVGGTISTLTSFFAAKWQAKNALDLQAKQQRHDRRRQREQWEWERDRETEQRDWERAKERAQIEYERRIEADRYQRETLGELQTVLDELVNSARDVASEKLDMYDRATPEEREADEMPTTEYYREVAGRFGAANDRMKVLGVRVQDEEIRRRLDPIYSMARTIFFRTPGFWKQLARADREELMLDFKIVDLADEANKIIGRKLRDLQPIEWAEQGVPQRESVGICLAR